MPDLPEKIWDWLEREWHVLKSAPLAFTLSLAIGAAGAFLLSDHLHSREIASANREALAARQERDLYKSKLQVGSPEEAAKQLAGLRDQVTALSAGTWEPLPAAQIAALSERIRLLKGPNRRVVVQCFSPRQCGRFAESLKDAFKKGGWEVGVSESPTHRSGLWIYPFNEESKVLQAALIPILGKVEMEEGQSWALDPSQSYWLAIGERVP